MITRMKKISLVVYHNSKDRFLKSLQQLGLVHLEVNSTVENEKIIPLKEDIQKLKKAESLLLKTIKEIKKGKKKKKLDLPVDTFVNNLFQDKEKLNELNSLRDITEKEIDLLYQWGDFDPDCINKINDIGVNVKFYALKTAKFNKLEKTDFAYEVINIYKGVVYFAVFYRNDEVPQDILATEIKLPIKSIDSLYGKLEDLNNEIKKQEKILVAYTGYLNVLQKNILGMEDKLSYNITDASLTHELEGAIMVITGWAPKNKVKKVEKALKKEDVVYIIEDPSKDDNVPILLKNDPFSKLFEPITKMHSLPVYNEIDPTPFFAPFFALFFGLCVADVGYGSILLFFSILTFFVSIRNKTIRSIALLCMVLSIMTIFGGFILNSFFGSEIMKLSIIPQEYKQFIILKEVNDSMIFAIILGILQLLVGFTLQTANRIRNYGLKGGMQPIGTMLLIISAVLALFDKNMKLGPIPLGLIIGFIPENSLTLIGMTFSVKAWICLGILTIGTLLVLLFNNVDKKIYIRPALGLWELYGLVTGVPGDILSYLRLFALGLSGGLLGSSFNQIAMVARDGIPVPAVGIAVMVIIMIFGHGLNLSLACIGAFVHPLRLILLEFYKSVSFSGGGKEYSPFRYKLILKKR